MPRWTRLELGSVSRAGRVVHHVDVVEVKCAHVQCHGVGSPRVHFPHAINLVLLDRGVRRGEPVHELGVDLIVIVRICGSRLSHADAAVANLQVCAFHLEGTVGRFLAAVAGF